MPIMEDRTIKVEIYDPPMCCPGGLCGPTIDPKLLEINEAILRVKEEFDGRVQVKRYLLGQQAAKFMQHQEVLGLLKAQGVQVLPITTVAGQIVKRGEYPSYDELKGMIQEEADR